STTTTMAARERPSHVVDELPIPPPRRSSLLRSSGSVSVCRFGSGPCAIGRLQFRYGKSGAALPGNPRASHGGGCERTGTSAGPARTPAPPVTSSRSEGAAIAEHIATLARRVSEAGGK